MKVSRWQISDVEEIDVTERKRLSYVFIYFQTTRYCRFDYVIKLQICNVRMFGRDMLQGSVQTGCAARQSQRAHDDQWSRSVSIQGVFVHDFR